MGRAGVGHQEVADHYDGLIDAEDDEKAGVVPSYFVCYLRYPAVMWLCVSMLRMSLRKTMEAASSTAV